MKTNEQLSKELSLRAARKMMVLKETFNRMLNDQPVEREEPEVPHEVKENQIKHK